MSQGISPTVSVILATYNWSNVLRYAMETVLWQTFTDFELLVIGDCCTDDTESVVSAFHDPRIQWHNLPQNSGNQAVPNNAGLQIARGQYTAYMHQDDLWLPNHLACLVETLRQHPKALAHTLMLEIGPEPVRLRRVLGLPNGGPLGPDRRTILTPSVMHDTEFARQIGGWRDWKTLYVTPPHDLWKRMLDSGCELCSVAEITVIKFHSAERKNSYMEKPDHDQREFFQRIQTEPDFLYRELLAVVDAQAHGIRHERILPPRPIDARPGWEIDQYRQIRGLGTTELGPHRGIKPFLFRNYQRLRRFLRKRLTASAESPR